jgi:hypothetical protein
VARFGLLHGGIAQPMAVAVEQTRREWAEGYRRHQAELKGRGADAASAELDVVLAALRKRVGQSFTFAELVQAYATADAWSRAAVEESEPAAGWPRRLAAVTDAAFHVYSRGAVDYEP